MSDSVAIFLTIMAVLLVMPLLSERVHLPGIVGLIIGGILIGPHGLGWLAADSRIELLATVGLLFLMFSAGLEVDLHQFKRVRNKALVFGLLTFLIPQLMGMAFGRWLGMSWLGAVLLGSAFSSHTLIAFPILVRLGIVRNEAVSVTVGATVLTDIAAFVVLAVVLSLQGGDLTPTYFLGLAAALALYAALVLLGLPRLGKLFFRRFHGQAVEFQFVLVALFIAALLAERIGVHAVVGAFLAGLAVNAALPHHSPVINRVLFVGESLFIPIFLVYSGMITDPVAFLTSSRTLLVGLGVTVIAYSSKFFAAWIAGRLFGYSRAERLTVWGLSQAQAAVTIPTLLIGLQTGLFDDTIFDAAIMMILLTSITSPLLVQRFGRQLKPAEVEKPRANLFERLLLSVANPQTQEYLIGLGSLLAHSHNGTLLVLNVAREPRGGAPDLEQQRMLLERVPELVADPDLPVELLRRVDESYARGILRAAMEKEATAILLGWRGQANRQQSIFGTVLDEVVWNARVPVLVGRISTPINALARVTLVIPQEKLSPGLAARTLELALNMAQDLNAPLLVLISASNVEALNQRLAAAGQELDIRVQALEGETVQAVSSRVGIQDLVIVTELGTPQRFRRSLGSIPERLTRATPASLLFVHYPSVRHH